jgi:hypothetical protein
MIGRTSKLVVFITLGGIIWLSTSAALAQNSVVDFHRILREKVGLDETDFAAVQQGQTVVKLLPVQEKREVAVSGLVSLQVPAEVFLQSFRETMARKSNPAILEIGSFSSQPTLDDLQGLTVDNRDLEDLKTCVVGACKLKLSAMMIERLHQEIDWEAPDHHRQATQLLKVMLLDYVRDYLARGDPALIEYNDKAKTVRLAEEQRALRAGSSYVYDGLPEFSQYLKDFPKGKLANVENAIVWSKMKFGLKPVIAINHITIYRNEKEVGPQILVASKQIYASHYFDSSLALTAFVSNPGSSSGSYLFYENRSRADGLGGMFGKIKRGIVEDRAVDGLTAILEQSKVNLNASVLGRTESAAPAQKQPTSRRWTIGRVRLLSGLFLITAFVVLLGLSNYHWRGRVEPRAN